MKQTHTLRLLLAGAAAVAVGYALSSCADMWLSTDTGFDFTQPGGFGIDIGVGGPVGHPSPPPPPPGGGPGFPGGPGPGGPPPGGPGWGPF